VSRVIAFRPDNELYDELVAYAAELDLSPGQAARTLVEAALGVERGKSPKKAALRAAVKQAIYNVASQGRRALSQGLDDARDRLEAAFGLEDDDA
jgi:hypothetical protein